MGVGTNMSKEPSLACGASKCEAVLLLAFTATPATSPRPSSLPAEPRFSPCGKGGGKLQRRSSAQVDVAALGQTAGPRAAGLQMEGALLLDSSRVALVRRSGCVCDTSTRSAGLSQPEA